MTRSSFFGLLILALIVAYIPVLHVPLEWFQTFFHEVSHGLAALLTGGTIARIELNLNGSGVCYTAGGWRLLVSFSGYSGAVLWGALLYLAVGTSSRAVTRMIVAMLGVIVMISGLLWTRDLTTVFVLFVILALVVVAYAAERYRLTQLAIRFIALYIMLSAARTPLHLLDGRSIGDGQTLANITYVPEFVWVLIWEAVALGALWFVYRVHGTRNLRSALDASLLGLASHTEYSRAPRQS